MVIPINPLARFYTGYSRHHNIHENNINVFRFTSLNSLLTAVNSAHNEKAIYIGYHNPHGFSHQFFIISNYNAIHLQYLFIIVFGVFYQTLCAA